MLTCFTCIHSSDLQSYLNTSMEVSCNFTLETYACAQVTISLKTLENTGMYSISENSLYATYYLFDWMNKWPLTVSHIQLKNFTANQLVSLLKCDLPGNSSHSKVLWKMLLTKLSFVLDPALDILANMVSIFLTLWGTYTSSASFQDYWSE